MARKEGTKRLFQGTGKKFIPTDEMREQVSILRAAGMREQDIPVFFKISLSTLQRHFKTELEEGVNIANRKVVDTLYQMATSGQHPSMSAFWAKTRMRWRENDPMPEEKPKEEQKIDFSKLNPEERELFKKLLSKVTSE